MQVIGRTGLWPHPWKLAKAGRPDRKLESAQSLLTLCCAAVVPLLSCCQRTRSLTGPMMGCQVTARLTSRVVYSDSSCGEFRPCVLTGSGHVEGTVRLIPAAANPARLLRAGSDPLFLPRSRVFIRYGPQGQPMINRRLVNGATRCDASCRHCRDMHAGNERRNEHQVKKSPCCHTPGVSCLRAQKACFFVSRARDNPPCLLLDDLQAGQAPHFPIAFHGHGQRSNQARRLSAWPLRYVDRSAGRADHGSGASGPIQMFRRRVSMPGAP